MNLIKLKHVLPVFLLAITGTMASAKIKHLATGELPHYNKEVALKFIENKGQWTPEAKYMTGIPGGYMFITDNGFVYNYENMEDEENYHHAAEAGKDVSNMVFHYHSYKVSFIGSNKDIKYTTGEKSSNYNNYFIGNDKSKWASKVGMYGVVNQNNIYKGINATIYSKGLSLKYDFTIAPGAEVNQIKISFEGVSPEITKDGNLKIVTSVNEVTEQAPYTYQIIDGKQKEIRSRYKLTKGILSYELLEDYDHTKELVIDPVLVFATYSGATGNGAYYAYSTTYDALGNTYAAGFTSGITWPTTIGAFQTTSPGTNSVCINKYNASGNTLIYSTYFGGNASTQPNALRCNSQNELVMVGATIANNLPTTAGAFDNTFSGGPSDLYVVRFSVDGSSLVGCTYIGGGGRDGALLDIFGNTTPSTQSTLTSSGVLSPCELNFDNAGNIWIVSNTESADFPVTAAAFQAANAGGSDGIVCKLSANCTSLDYSSYYGGNGDDALYGIEFLSNGHAVVVGGTQSANITTTAGTLHTTAPGGWDGYAGIINPNQNTLIASTYLGTADNENAAKLQVDGSDNIYVMGRTMGNSGYPVSAGVFSIANGDVYIDKLNSTLTTSLLSTRVGNPETPTSTSTIIRYLPTAFLLDICQNVYVAGLTPSHAAPNLPTTPDAFSAVSKPFWFCVLEPDFNALLFASFYGIGTGDHPHCGTSRLDPQGIVYHSFCSATNGATSVGTPGAWSEQKQNTSNDIYTYKFNFEATGVNSNFELDPVLSGNDTGCAPYQVHFVNTSTSAEAFTWDFGDGSPTSNLAEPTHTFTTAGTYTISLHANNPESCVTDDTAFITVTVLQVEPPSFDVHDTILCTLEQSIHVGATINNPSQYTSIEWSPLNGIIGANNTADITVDPSINTIYNVTVKNAAPGICEFEDTKTVTIDLAPRILDIINSDMVVCEGTVVPITAIGGNGYTYRWVPSTGVSDSTALNPTITVNQPNVYTLTGSYANCPDTSVIINIGMHYMPHLTVSEDKYVCQGTDVTLESAVTPFRNDYVYSWTPVTDLTNPDGPNTHFIADEDITYILNIQTPIGCADADTVNVTVYPTGFGSIVSDTGYCSGINGAVNLWANGGDTYQWSPLYGLSGTNVANPIANPPQTTEYTVLITDAHNCLDTEKVTVSVYPAATINLPDSVNVYPGENYQIEPGTNCMYFSWFPSSGLDNSLVSNPHMSPEVRTRYFVTATTEHGCAIKDSVDILVKETVLDMPNAFMPGNNANPVFKPSKRGIAKLNSFTIYNRWGNKVYNSTNIDAGWDGTYNDVAQPLGVYMYVIDAVSDSGRNFKMQGNVTLIR
ncbi:PKD domain-containing protein [Taibaiella lutea]|uniref:PKD domain-containing protein n=1 Tax=Taibaiella lutea TaxID=2608001 RepID=A0A5M6CN64_9BACT|nr:gliding motility-associated C-terminal domain-containing protein [Taibaiella lutea]KAA5536497.1 PKD domain-containing protein [Taibaiella lutea]